MLIFSGINFFAVFVSAIAYWVLGYVWFCLLFGKTWGKLIQKHGIKLKDPSKQEMAWKFVLSLILNFIVAWGVAVLINSLGVMTGSTAIALGLILGICFSAATVGTNYLWESRPVKLVIIDICYPILGIIIAALILTYWR